MWLVFEDYILLEVDINYFVIYLDTAVLIPPVDKMIDCLDFTKDPP